MLTVLDSLPERFLDTPDCELHRLLPGPTLIHLPGRRPAPLFVSVERRTVAAMERARQLVASLRSYLMATDVDGVEAVAEEEGGFWQSLRSLFGGAQPAVDRKKANGKPALFGVRRSGYVVTASG